MSDQKPAVSYDELGNPCVPVDPKTVPTTADTVPFDRRLPGETAQRPAPLPHGAYEEYGSLG